MSIDLKPCPFCGSSATLEDNRLVWFVRCDGCGAVVMGDRAPEPEVEMPGEYWDPFRRSAMDRWNRRAVVAGDQADFRALCAELVSRWDNANGDHDLCGLADIMDRARSALAQPPATGPTDEDIEDLAEVFNGYPVPAIRRALELWASPAVAPVALDERLPEPGDCAPWPDSPSYLWCWAGRVLHGAWEWAQLGIDHASKDLGRSMRGQGWTHWHPWWALPLPQPRPTEQQP